MSERGLGLGANDAAALDACGLLEREDGLLRAVGEYAVRRAEPVAEVGQPLLKRENTRTGAAELEVVRVGSGPRAQPSGVEHCFPGIAL